MPKLLSGVLDHFPDHTLDIPNPENTVRHDVPNACNLCHADRKPADMQRSVESWWPEARSKQGRRFRLAEAIDEKTAAGSFGALTEVVRDGSETPTLRGAAALLLGQRFPREAASVLLPLLGERDQLVRSRFVEGLGYAQAREAGDAVAGLGNDPSIHVRQMAALVLASFRDPRGIAALQRLADDPETRALSRPHIMLAIDAANHGDLGRAQRELEFVVAEVPYATDALVMLGDIHARQGDMAAAKALFEEALRFNPRQKNALARLQVLH
jgi:HEAT repeat protein